MFRCDPPLFTRGINEKLREVPPPLLATSAWVNLELHKVYLKTVFAGMVFCFQEMALSSGYFFTCPICRDKNNRTGFLRHMKKFGVFVPQR